VCLVGMAAMAMAAVATIALVARPTRKCFIPLLEKREKEKRRPIRTMS
jgi:hypothetical protein